MNPRVSAETSELVVAVLAVRHCEARYLIQTCIRCTITMNNSTVISNDAISINLWHRLQQFWKISDSYFLEKEAHHHV